MVHGLQLVNGEGFMVNLWFMVKGLLKGYGLKVMGYGLWVMGYGL